MAQQQSSRGYFGEFGGQFAPETLMPALQELEQAYNRICRTRQFTTEYNELLTHYNGRPTPLYHAKNLTTRCGGAQIYLKREDLNHTGAHKITNSLGQALLARQMGKTRLIAETGAGQHGVATATVAALLGMECDIYMGAIDMARQSPNVFRMRLLGARVISVDSGGQTLKDAINEAMRDWSKSVRTTHYVVGSALCAHPFPSIVRDFQSIIGKETKKQLNALTGRLPDEIVACVGGGSNAIGIFAPFLEDTQVALTGVEAGGHGVTTRKHAARLCGAKSSRKGILHGSFSFVLQDRNGQIADTHSISAGLDYSAIGPQHAFLHTSGRATYTNATDKEALEAFGVLCRTEGIIPALESSHAIAYTLKRAPQMSPEQILVVNLSGRGDKDIFHVAQQMGTTI